MHPLLDRLLAEQDGVVSRSQAMTAGVGEAEVRRLLSRRELVSIHRGVYVNHTGGPMWSQRAWAGVLATWPSALSHSSALRAAEGPGSTRRQDVIEVAVDCDRHIARPDGVTMHRSAHLEERVQWHLGPPRVRYHDAVLDVAASARTERDALAELAAGPATSPGSRTRSSMSGVSVEIPAPVPAGSLTSWSDDVDVLVVGAGMAGTCAAVEAARAGARVLLLDRGGPGTSTSAMSGGDFYLGGGTAVQQATGHEDSAEEMEKYLLASSPDADPAKIRLYCQDSVDHFDWLEGLGFEFERSYYAAKAVVQPGTEGLMYTGSEKAHPFCELARPAPRGHKPPFVGDVGGGGFVVERALEQCARLGVEVRYDTGVTGLVVEDAGGAQTVVGATWKGYAETGAVRAGAVVLAAGGFVMNEEMIAAYAPRLQALVARGMALGNSFDDGLGIRLGESVGGMAEHMEGAFFTSPFYPPDDTLKGIVVNKAGERFVNEDGYHSRTASALFEQPGAEGYLILDSATMVEPSYGFQPLVDGWETVEEMEAGLGMPEGALVATMGDYDKHAAEGHDPAFHKAAEWLVPLDQGPWGAYDLTPGKAFYAGFTMGGLRVSVDGEVLRADGAAVSGVYAAGAAAANIALDGAGYSSGTQLGEASYFGRRAGRHAAGA